jgi:flagellar hook-length control protein FliK
VKERVNIAALQSMLGTNQLAVNNVQKSDLAPTNFGAIFASISTNAAIAQPTVPAVNVEIPIELIANLFNATTVEELENALQAFPGSEKIELPTGFEAMENNQSMEDLAKLLSINPEKMLERLIQLFEQAGLTKAETEELSVATDMWTLLSMIDDTGSRFFEALNSALQKPATSNEAIELLAFLKTIDLIAPKTDMDVSMEQKVDSFHHMLSGAAGQFEQRMIAMGKQEPLPFIQQKSDFRIVLETNSSNSTNAEANSNKQPDTTSHSSVAHGTGATVRVEVPIQQAESNPLNRSESFMKEMQALMKRSNFGQVGGSNRMLIKLYPEHLGQIRIELLETNGIMTARILASTAFAKGLLDSQLHQLKHAFNQQNLQVDRIDIAQSIQESQKNEREQAFNEQFKREQQSDDKKEKKSSEEDRSFDEYMIELEV